MHGPSCIFWANVRPFSLKGDPYCDGCTGSIVVGFEDAGTREGRSILWEYGEPLTIINVMVAGGIEVNSPGLIVPYRTRIDIFSVSRI
jgi:hypothetical protein